jgi:hypothetical protein
LLWGHGVGAARLCVLLSIVHLGQEDYVASADSQLRNIERDLAEQILYLQVHPRKLKTQVDEPSKGQDEGYANEEQNYFAFDFLIHLSVSNFNHRHQDDEKAYVSDDDLKVKICKCPLHHLKKHVLLWFVSVIVNVFFLITNCTYEKQYDEDQ